MSRPHPVLRALPVAVALLFSQAQAQSPDGGLQAELQTRLSALLGDAVNQASKPPLRIASPVDSGTDELARLLQAPLDGPAAMRMPC